MTDELGTQDTPQPKTEVELLRERAKMMGLKFHPLTGLDKMRAMVEEAMPNKPAEAGLEAAPASATKIPYETKTQREARKRKTAGQLIRVIVTNMNQRTKDLPGQVYAAGNSFCTFKKYIPFNAERGFHIPYIIVEMLKNKKCQVFHTVEDKKGRKTRKGKLVPEFNIVVLPALTVEELKDLARAQALTETSA